MRQVVLALALTSSASAARMDTDSGSGSARYYSDALLAGTLGDDLNGAPHLFYAELWSSAATAEDRRRVLAAAKQTLREIRYSQADATKAESWQELRARIVKYGEGLPKAQVALSARTLPSMVARARRELGREEEFGRRPVNGHALKPAERRARARELAAQGMSAKAIADALDMPYITIRRDLGRSA